MNDISTNPYIKTREHCNNNFTLNAFLFDICVAERFVDKELLLFAVRDLLSILRFRVQLLGYKFLSRLVEQYLVDSNYSEAEAINKIAEYYGTDSEYVYANIVGNIKSNVDFIEIAARLLNRQSEQLVCSTVNDAVEIIGAVYKFYYNFAVTDEKECTELRSKTLNFNRVAI